MVIVNIILAQLYRIVWEQFCNWLTLWNQDVEINLIPLIDSIDEPPCIRNASLNPFPSIMKAVLLPDLTDDRAVKHTKLDLQDVEDKYTITHLLVVLVRQCLTQSPCRTHGSPPLLRLPIWSLLNTYYQLSLKPNVLIFMWYKFLIQSQVLPFPTCTKVL